MWNISRKKQQCISQIFGGQHSVLNFRKVLEKNELQEVLFKKFLPQILLPEAEKCKQNAILSFSVTVGTERTAGLWSAMWDQCPDWHNTNCDHLSWSSKIPNFSLSTMVANIQLSEKISSYPSGAAGPKLALIIQ